MLENKVQIGRPEKKEDAKNINYLSIDMSGQTPTSPESSSARRRWRNCANLSGNMGLYNP